jgi:hypothetical protein
MSHRRPGWLISAIAFFFDLFVALPFTGLPEFLLDLPRFGFVI